MDVSNPQVIVLWCDSPSGKISLRVHKDGTPVTFSRPEIPAEIPFLLEAHDIFPVLRRKDGTKIAVPDILVPQLFGWNI